jgi:hypothetical protein
MTRSTEGGRFHWKGWGVVGGAALLAIGAAAVLVIGTPRVEAQAQRAPDPNYDGTAVVERVKEMFPDRPKVSQVGHDFAGVWRGINPRGNFEGGGNCGSLKDHYGNPRELCEFPVDRLEPYMNGRMRAWIEFFDEPLSPRWDCVAAGLQTGLQEGYLWEFSLTADMLVQRWEQSLWTRYIYMDGRPHPPETQAFYHGHSIGKVISPNEVIVDSTNFTFDPDGWDDHSHLATSTRKHFIEHYTLVDPESLQAEFTVDDPIFLKQPFRWRHNYRKTQQPFVSAWDCDAEAGHEELYRTIPQKYPDDTEFQKYNK